MVYARRLERRGRKPLQVRVLSPAPTMTTVDAIVTAVVPEFEVAYARDGAGFQYAVTPDTAGTPWNALREGQGVRLEVTASPVRTLSVQVLP